MHLEITQLTDRPEQVTSSLIDKLYNLAYENETTGVTSQLDTTSTLSGRIEASAAYEDAVTFLMAKFPNLYITVPNNNYYIRFKDPIVEQICLSEFSTDHIGVTKQEASRVTSLQQKFSNLDITSLEDLSNFTNISVNMTMVFYLSEAYVSSYFANNTTWQNRTYLSPYIHPTIIPIKMPHGSTVNFYEYMFGSLDNRTKLLFTINWNGAVVNNTHSSLNGAVFHNCYLTWDDSLIPLQASLPRMFRNCSLNKVIFREGIAATHEQFLACTVMYVEYPTTTTNVDMLFTNFRQDSANLGVRGGNGCVVIKAVTPPTLNATSSGVYVDTVRSVLPGHIYVPDNSVDAYKSATGWSELSSIITAMSLMTPSEREAGTVTDEDINRV